MNKTQKKQNSKKPSLALPLIFAFTGIAAMATSIILVPKLAQNLPQTKTEVPCPQAGSMPLQAPPCPQTTACPACECPAGATAPTENSVKNNPNEIQPASGEKASNPVISETGPWKFTLDSKTYKVDDNGKAAIKSIANLLANDSNIKIQLVGINNPKKSRKKAKFAASTIKDKIVKIEKSTRRQIKTKGEQKPDATDLTVTATIVDGGAK